MELIMENMGIIIGVVAAIVVLAILASGYVKAPPDTAFIISGLKRKQKVLVGKPGLRFRFWSGWIRSV